MRCNVCGRDVSDHELKLDSTNVATRSGGRSAYTRTTPIWVCNDCAAYRRGTFRILYWLVGVIAVIGALSFIAGLLR